MAGYDPKKAGAYNKLRQQGLNDAAALKQSGINDADALNYAVNDIPGDPNRGRIGPLIDGGGKIAGVDYEKYTPAELRDQARFDKGLQSVDYDVKADSRPSSKTQINYTTNSTEQVSGGGERTEIAGKPQPTAASRALQPKIDAKQAEIDQFTKENPSDFARKKQGLPPLSPEESAARKEKFSQLSQEKTALKNDQFDAERPGVTTIIEKPNTTTNTSTTTYSTSSNNDDVEAPDSQDEALSRQEEARLDAQPDVVTGGGSRTRTVDVNADGTIVQGSFQETVNAPEPQQVPVQDSLSQGEEFVQNDAPAAVDTETVPADANESSSYTSSPEGVDPDQDSAASAADAQAQLDEAVAKNDAQLYGGGDGSGSIEASTKQKAQEQAALQARFNQPANGDWRVRLRIAPNSNYLYNASDPGILAPLKASDGVIFPYTPSISTSYNANYDVTDLTHSNYRGQFYKNSNTGDITLNGTFTAQDTAEAEYMLAVIHFFRSVTKMFYGQDAQRGAPPPLVYLFGLGQYQFNNHPCVVKTFSYSLPTDVDYIRTQPNNYGQNLLNRRVATTSAPANTIGSVLGRLSNAVDLLGNILKKGALPGGGSRPGQPGVSQQAVYNTSNATYVPTKIEIQLSLLPIQTRNQVSQQFSLKDYANGALLRGGFW